MDGQVIFAFTFITVILAAAASPGNFFGIVATLPLLTIMTPWCFLRGHFCGGFCPPSFLSGLSAASTSSGALRDEPLAS